jgi:hypothetical protein
MEREEEERRKRKERKSSRNEVSAVPAVLPITTHLLVGESELHTLMLLLVMLLAHNT